MIQIMMEKKMKIKKKKKEQQGQKNLQKILDLVKLI